MVLLLQNKSFLAIFVVNFFSQVISQEETKKAQDGIWRVFHEETSLPCVLLKGNIEFKVDSLQDNHPETVIKVPEGSISEGSCLTLWGDYQDLKLKWSTNIPDNDTLVTNSIYFGFATQWESEYSDLIIGPDDYALNTITVVYHGDESSNMTLVSYSVSDFIAFQTPKNKSFSCPTKNVLEIGELTITFSDFQFQAFQNTTDFIDSIQCDLDKDDKRNLFLSILQWTLISLFLAGLIGAALVVSVGIIRKRLDTMNIGYSIVEDT